MSRINGPVWKTSRRLGFSILETGEELQKRAYAPGQHGPTKRVKLTNYGQQLREKQKIRYMYGLNERQFYNTFIKASKMKGKKVDIPSFIAKPGMVVEIKEKSRDMKAINEALEATLNTVAFIDVDKDAKKGTYLRLPERSELNAEFNELLVVEFYNR